MTWFFYYGILPSKRGVGCHCLKRRQLAYLHNLLEDVECAMLSRKPVSLYDAFYLTLYYYLHHALLVQHSKLSGRTKYLWA